MSDRHVLLRDWTDGGIMPAGSDAVALLSVTYSPIVSGQRTVSVHGLSRGAATVSVSVGTAAASARQDVTNLPPSGLFVATVSLNATGDEIATISARNSGAGLTGEDHAALTFGDSAHLTLQQAPLSLMPASRLAYGAGNADRLHLSRTFVSLQPPVNLGGMGLSAKVYAVAQNGDVKVLDNAKLTKAVSAQVKALNTARSNGSISMARYWQRLRGVIGPAISRALRTATPKERTIALGKRDAVRLARFGSAAPAKGGAPPSARAFGGSTPSPTVSSPVNPSMVATVVVDLGRADKGPDIGATLKEEWDKRLRESEKFRRMGVLLHDRLRFRPSNLVVGEPIFQMALTPGEEVQVRQTSETRSRTAFTEINDRESEKNTSFSSSWSTDITSSLSTQDNFVSSAQIGANASASVPDVPIEVGGSASSSMNEAHNIGAQHSATSRVTKTATAAARMRSQHRVQLEVTREGSSSLAQTRTFRNFNNLRTMHHKVFKVYRREQITLERWDAQLCLKLVVDDPARSVRDAFLIALSKIDPNNQENYHVGPPPTDRVGDEKTFTVTAPPDAFENPFHLWQEDRWVAWTPAGGSLRILTNAPAGYKLTALSIVMTDVALTVFGPVTPIDGSGGGTQVVEAELQNVGGQPFIKVAGRFKYFGGAVRWDVKPSLGTDGTGVVLSVNLPLRWSAPTSLVGELESAISSATFRIQSQWQASNSVLAEYMEKLDQARAEMIANFDAERVYELHRIAEADYPASVVDEAVGRQLTYPANFDFSSLAQIFDLESVVIDNLPYWASPVTRDAHRHLLARLQSLPAAFETTRILTDALLASSAVVYLPVRPGQEARALELLPEAKGVGNSVAQQITDYRTAHFGLTVPGSALTMADIDTPVSPTATPANATAWATAWEQAPRMFDVLAQWSDLIPTDGLHIETHLSDTTVADERETRRLERL